METQNFTPEKEVIELTKFEKLFILDDEDNPIPATEEPEKKDVPTVH